MTLSVDQLWRYPVKTLAGERVTAAELTVGGIAGDRGVHVRGPEGVRTSRRQHRLLGLHGSLDPTGRPLVDGHPWDSPEALGLVRAAAGGDAWLAAHDGLERFDVLPLLVATDGAIADATATAKLRAAVRGLVLAPGDADFDEARRVWNGMIDKHPHLIVQAASADDVAPVIAFARETGLPLAIRGGGHNVAGNGTVDDGIVLDLGRLNGVEVDPGARLVRVEAGATLGDVDRATEPHALAVPVGVVSGTGIAGLTLGGGVGWLVRRHGLTIDNLVSAEVVLATGERVRASDAENADLFWGLRGGGGNFGVVTSFTFRAHPLDQDVFAGTLIYERPRWAEALRAYVGWTAGAPDDVTTLITFMVPPVDWELGDRPLMFLGFAWAGANRAEGEEEIDRLRAACAPDASVLDPTRWLAFQSAFDAAMPKGVRAWWRNASFDRLDGPTIDAIVEHCGAQAWVGTAADLHHMGGAFGRVAEDATAFPNRAAQFWLNVYGFWPDPADDAARIAWVKGFSDATQPHAMAGQYVNFLGHEDATTGGDDGARRKALEAYGPAKLARLAELKRRFDPENLFRINHNIPPTA